MTGDLLADFIVVWAIASVAIYIVIRLQNRD